MNIPDAAPDGGPRSNGPGVYGRRSDLCGTARKARIRVRLPNLASLTADDLAGERGGRVHAHRKHPLVEAARSKIERLRTVPLVLPDARVSIRTAPSSGRKRAAAAAVSTSAAARPSTAVSTSPAPAVARTSTAVSTSPTAPATAPVHTPASSTTPPTTIAAVIPHELLTPEPRAPTTSDAHSAASSAWSADVVGANAGSGDTRSARLRQRREARAARRRQRQERARQRRAAATSRSAPAVPSATSNAESQTPEVVASAATPTPAWGTARSELLRCVSGRVLRNWGSNCLKWRWRRGPGSCWTAMVMASSTTDPRCSETLHLNRNRPMVR